MELIHLSCLNDIASVSLLDVACNDGSSEVREIALVSLRLLCRNPSCREVRAIVQRMVVHLQLGTGHYIWWGVAPKRNVFRGKNFADPTIKK